MRYKDIYYQKEEQYHSINQQHFKQFVESFTKDFKIDITEMTRKKGVQSNDYCKQFFILKYMVNLYYPQYIYEFFHRLEESGFDVSSEIVDAMKQIGRNTINTLNESVSQYVMLSPYINNVSINNGKITIYSDKFGDYSFYSTRNYLKENKKALKIINKYTTQGYCHHLSWELISYLEKVKLVTTLLPAYYEGNYYHSIVRNQDDFIIDVANEAVYDDDTRDLLFKGHIVVETEKENLDKRLQEAIMDEDEESKETDFVKAMLLTLHKESKKYKKN